jgi:hypothetical protein|tara:strand:+ start:637 stop:867 length:231 start_codon:yes stop_codon:yes gene_type:complete
MIKENKLGPYVQKLMTTIVSKDIDEFVKDLAWGELRRLNSDVEEFLRKYQREDAEADLEKVKKQLLQEQEDKKDGK